MKRRIEPFEAPRIGSRVELINGTWFWIDDQSEPDRCPSCGVPYTEHLGLIGTCKRVQELTDALHNVIQCDHHNHCAEVPRYVQIARTALRTSPAPVENQQSELERLRTDRDRLHVLLSCAHGALADCGLPVPGMDQDIAPVIRKLTEDRDRYKRLAGELARALRAMQTMSHHQEPRKLDEALTWRQNDMKAQEMCKTALAKAKQEGVIE